MQQQSPQQIQARQTAYLARLIDIIEGKYVKEEGWTPNYILTSSNRKISRANIMAVVVEKSIDTERNYDSVVVDDGTAKISIRDFEKRNLFHDVQIGEVAIIIGKPREYGFEKYILPEIIKKIENAKWIEVRKLELSKIYKNIPKQQTTEQQPTSEENVIKAEETVEDAKEEPDLQDKIVETVKSMDTGNGADVQKIIDELGPDSEKAINKLLLSGEIFELSPGKIKIL